MRREFTYTFPRPSTSSLYFPFPPPLFFFVPFSAPPPAPRPAPHVVDITQISLSKWVEAITILPGAPLEMN
jgi:hypothetical protein